MPHGQKLLRNCWVVACNFCNQKKCMDIHERSFASLLESIFISQNKAIIFGKKAPLLHSCIFYFHEDYFNIGPLSTPPQKIRRTPFFVFVCQDCLVYRMVKFLSNHANSRYLLKHNFLSQQFYTNVKKRTRFGTEIWLFCSIARSYLNLITLMASYQMPPIRQSVRNN